MEEYIVPNLYYNLNLNTLPNIIKEEFFKLGFWYNKEIFIKPYSLTISFDLDAEKIQFYAHSNTNKFIENLIIEKRLLDKNYEILTYNDFQKIYVKEYGRGFYNGYNNYSKGLKDRQNEIFETNNNQIAHTIFSKVINRDLFEKRENYPFKLVYLEDEELVRKKLNKDVDFVFAEKEDYYNSGYQSGEKYKAWSLILHKPTLFEEIFTKHLDALQNKEEVEKKDTIKEEPNLNLKSIPNFNLQQRYSLFEQLGFDSVIDTLNTEKQSSKHKILAILLGISPDNAKHLMNDSYKSLTTEQKEELEEFLYRNKIKL